MDETKTQDPLIGSKLGSCVIQRKIGTGGMGAVYLGQHEGLNKHVAVKVMAVELMGQKAFRDRFVREARTAAKLEHPNVVQVFDVGDTDRCAFIVMQFVDGRSLDEILRDRGRLSVKESVSIVKRVAHALAAAHKLGVIHRDIKPANILISKDGIVKVADFGLARDVEGGQSISQTGQIVGTPHYMSPEQAASGPVDGRSDLYSLGATFYHLVTGKRPFDGGSALSVVLKHLNETPPPPESIEPSVPPAVAAIIGKLMSKNAADRYASAEELIRDLDRLKDGSVVVTTKRPAPAPPRRRAPWVAAGAALAVALGVGGYFLFRPKPKPPTDPAEIRPAAKSAAELHEDHLRKICEGRPAEECEWVRELDARFHDLFAALRKNDIDTVLRMWLEGPESLTMEHFDKFKRESLEWSPEQMAGAEVENFIFTEKGDSPQAVMEAYAQAADGGERLSKKLLWRKRVGRWYFYVPKVAQALHQVKMSELKKGKTKEQEKWVEELDHRIHEFAAALWEKNWDKVAGFFAVDGRRPFREKVRENLREWLEGSDWERVAAEPERIQFADSPQKGADVAIRVWVWPPGNGKADARPVKPTHWIMVEGAWRMVRRDK